MNLRRPRILYVCPTPPRDQGHGGQLRALHIGRALQQVGDVRLVIVHSGDSDESTPAATSEFDLAAEIHAGPPAARGVRQRLDWALNPRCRNVHGCLAAPGAIARFRALLRESDLVWFLKLRSANPLRAWRWPRSVMDVDDVPSVFATAQRRAAPALRQRLEAALHGWIFRRRERLLLERFTVISVCSTDDKRHLGFNDRVHVIPNGFVRPAHPPLRRPHHPPRLGFVGLFGYAPNADGVRWFVDRCWGEIRHACPGARLRLVGRDTDGPLKPAAEGVDGLGWLADPAEEIATWSLMIVPIHAGAGTRIKIVDAFSRCCPVVSTRFGAYGYEVADGRQLLLADDPAAFTQACLRLLREPQFATRLAANAWDDFLERWTWDAIAPQAWAAVDDCLRRSGRPALAS